MTPELSEWSRDEIHLFLDGSNRLQPLVFYDLPNGSHIHCSKCSLPINRVYRRKLWNYRENLPSGFAGESLCKTCAQHMINEHDCCSDCRHYFKLHYTNGCVSGSHYTSDFFNLDAYSVPGNCSCKKFNSDGKKQVL